MTIRVGAGLSTVTDGVAAARIALAAALAPLGGARPDLVLLFVAPQFEEETRAIVDLVTAATDGAALLGCSAGGIIGGGREVEDAPAVAVWAASLPGAAIEPFRLTFERDGEHGLIDGMAELPAGAARPVVLLLADPYTFPADRFLEHLNAEDPGVPVVGGMASGALGAGRSRLYYGGRVLKDGAVGAVLSGAGARPVVSQGCRPVGETYAITRAEANVIHELGGISALRRVEDLYGAASDRDKLLMRRGLHVGQAISELKPELRRGDFLIRNIVSVDHGSGALAISDTVEVGQTVQFQVRDAESAREDLRELLEAERRAERRPVAGALLFSCNGRGQALFGQPDVDVGAVRRAFGEVPIAGFFAAGELGPIGGRNYLHGFTASVLLFREAA